MKASIRTLDELLQHERFVQRLARSLLGTNDEADDLVQETWLRALQHPPDSQTLGWLGTVMRNLARDWRTGESRRDRREAVAARAEETPPLQQVIERQEVQRQIVHALGRLPEGHASAIVLRFFDGLPPREIARRLSVPVETVKKRLTRGLSELREELDGTFKGGRAGWTAALPLLVSVPASGSATAATATLPAIVGAFLMSTAGKVLCALVIVAIGSVFVTRALSRPDAPPPAAQVPTAPRVTVADAPAQIPATPPISPKPFREIPESKPAVVSGETAEGRPAAGALDVTVTHNGQPAPGVQLSVRPMGGRHIIGSGRTQALGRAAIVDLAAGWYEVASDRGDLIETEVVNGKTTSVSFALAGRTTLSVVVKTDTGDLIAGATVIGNWPEKSRTMALGATDNRGFLQVTSLSGVVTIDARAEGHWNPDPRMLRSGPGATSYDLTFVLKKGGGSLSGRIQDSEGIPVAGASIRCTVGEWATVPGVDRAGTMSGQPTPAESSSQKDGTFGLSGLAPTTWMLEVRKPGYALSKRQITAAPDSEPVIVTLQRAGGISGRVLNDAGEPCAHATVWAPSGKVHEITYSGTNGGYRLESLAPGVVEVSAYRVDQGQATTRVTVPSDGTVVADLTLSRGRVVTGRVLDENRNALPRWIVSVKGESPQIRRHTFTDENGRFVVANAPAASMTVSVSPNDDEGTRVASVVTNEDHVEIVLSASQIASFWITGVVVDEAGRPLANQVLSARQGGSSRSDQAESRLEPPSKALQRSVNTTASTDAAGKFRIGPFGNGLVTISAWGRENTYCPVKTVQVNRDTDLGTLELAAPVEVEVTMSSGTATAIEILDGEYFVVGHLELTASERWKLRLGKGNYILRWKAEGVPRETTASVGDVAGLTKIQLH